MCEPHPMKFRDYAALAGIVAVVVPIVLYVVVRRKAVRAFRTASAWLW